MIGRVAQKIPVDRADLLTEMLLCDAETKKRRRAREGFSYLELTGGYAQFKTHEEAYKLFAQNVEDLIRHEIKDYIVAGTPKPNGNKQG